MPKVVVDNCCDCDNDRTYRSLKLGAGRSPLRDFTPTANTYYLTITFTRHCEGHTGDDERVWTWNPLSCEFELTSETYNGASAALAALIAEQSAVGWTTTSTTQISSTRTCYGDGDVELGHDTGTVSDQHTMAEVLTAAADELATVFDSAFVTSNMVERRIASWDAVSEDWTYADDEISPALIELQGRFAIVYADPSGTASSCDSRAPSNVFDDDLTICASGDLRAPAASGFVTVARTKITGVDDTYCRLTTIYPEGSSASVTVDTLAGDDPFFVPLPTVTLNETDTLEAVVQLDHDTFAEDLEYVLRPPWINDYPAYDCP